MPGTVWVPEYLKANGIILAQVGFCILDGCDEFEGVETKGTSTDVPHAIGSLSNPERVAERTIARILYVFGDRDHNGAVIAAGRKQGCKNNVAWLRANLGIGDPDVPFVWHQDDGTEKTATGRIHFRPGVKFGGGTGRAMKLDIVLPTGEFT